MQIIQTESMNDEQTWDITRQIVRGLKYLHDNNIVHGDMKPNNLLVASDGTVKLGDFGISRIKDDGELLTEHAGTPSFMAPEVVSGESYDGKLADVYSVGATMYYIRFGQPAFVAKSRQKLYQKILNDPVSFPSDVLSTVADGLIHLIQGLMTKSPSMRITMARLIVYPWLQTRPGGENTPNEEYSFSTSNEWSSITSE